jgi:dipeptidyl aminopeptidase/acylaminoacyl peptidase
MKQVISKIIISTTFIIFNQICVAATQLDDIKGAWLGNMVIPGGPTLRIGIEVFRKADGKWGGNIASLDQGARYISVSSVAVKNNFLTLQMAGAPVKIVGQITDDKKVINAKFHQGDSVFKLDLKRIEQLPEQIRKQTPKKAEGYTQREVNYQSVEDGIWLSGTLTAPQKVGQYPAIMLVAGSGPNHRDSYHAGHRPFKVLADHFTKLGFIVLRSDKRGVNRSSGIFQDATLKDFVMDTQAGLQFLKKQSNVEPNQIVLIGHSEGSLVSAMVSEVEKVQGIVSLAGPGMSVKDILLLQDQTEPAAKGATKSETDLLLEFSSQFYSMVLETPSSIERKNKVETLYAGLTGKMAEAVDKWVNKNSGTLSFASAESDSFREFLQQTPLPSWNKFKGKALILNGDMDSQVPAKQNIEGILSALNEEQVEVESKIFRGLNHMFQPANSGAVDEYSKIETTLDNEVIKSMSIWLARNFEK